MMLGSSMTGGARGTPWSGHPGRTPEGSHSIRRTEGQGSSGVPQGHVLPAPVRGRSRQPRPGAAGVPTQGPEYRLAAHVAIPPVRSGASRPDREPTRELPGRAACPKARPCEEDRDPWRSPMSSIDVRNENPAPAPAPGVVDMNLEVIVIAGRGSGPSRRNSTDPRLAARCRRHPGRGLPVDPVHASGFGVLGAFGIGLTTEAPGRLRLLSRGLRHEATRGSWWPGRGRRRGVPRRFTRRSISRSRPCRRSVARGAAMARSQQSAIRTATPGCSRK